MSSPASPYFATGVAYASEGQTIEGSSSQEFSPFASGAVRNLEQLAALASVAPTSSSFVHSLGALAHASQPGLSSPQPPTRFESHAEEQSSPSDRASAPRRATRASTAARSSSSATSSPSAARRSERSAVLSSSPANTAAAAGSGGAYRAATALTQSDAGNVHVAMSAVAAVAGPRRMQTSADYGGGRRLPSQATDELNRWLYEHAAYPYPSDTEKNDLCDSTGAPDSLLLSALSETADWRLATITQGSRRSKSRITSSTAVVVAAQSWSRSPSRAVSSLHCFESTKLLRLQGATTAAVPLRARACCELQQAQPPPRWRVRRKATRRQTATDTPHRMATVTHPQTASIPTAMARRAATTTRRHSQNQATTTAAQTPRAPQRAFTIGRHQPRSSRHRCRRHHCTAMTSSLALGRRACLRTRASPVSLWFTRHS